LLARLHLIAKLAAAAAAAVARCLRLGMLLGPSSAFNHCPVLIV
jgi:hypothetical protein